MLNGGHQPMAGTLFLVLGPSGAGKDTLLDGARAAIEGSAGAEHTVFAKRWITRAPEKCSELEMPVSHEEMDAYTTALGSGGTTEEYQQVCCVIMRVVLESLCVLVHDA